MQALDLLRRRVIGIGRAVLLQDALLLDVELLQLELCALDAFREFLEHLFLELFRDLCLDRHRHLERNRIHVCSSFLLELEMQKQRQSPQVFVWAMPLFF